MKILMSAALLAFTLPALAADTPAGKVLAEEGKVFSNNHGAVVRKALKSGEKSTNTTTRAKTSSST